MDREEFDNYLKTHKLEQFREQLAPLLKETIRLYLKPTSEDLLPKGTSKMGGRPDLPAEIAWPTTKDGASLSFIAQLNLAELKPYDFTKLFPPSGMLYFF